MIFKFSGINLYSKNPDVTFDFYKKLGFRVIREPDETWYGAELALTEAADQPELWIWRADEDDAAKNHIVFLAGGSLDAVYEEIRAAGIACEPPFRAAWGGYELILHDPDGNELLFL